MTEAAEWLPAAVVSAYTGSTCGQQAEGRVGKEVSGDCSARVVRAYTGSTCGQ